MFSRDGAAVKSRVDVVSRGLYFSGAYLDGCRPHDPKPDIHCSRSDRLSRTMATSAGLRRDAGALWAKSVISQKSPGQMSSLAVVVLFRVLLSTDPQTLCVTR